MRLDNEIECIFGQAKECAEVMERDLSPQSKAKLEQRPWLFWLPSFNSGAIKINTDASRRNTDGMTAIGGVLRDNKGVWIKGCVGCTGITNIHLAEMRAIREALLIARELNCTKVDLETDSETAIYILYGSNKVLFKEYTLVEDCRKLLNLDTWEASATNQPRERNRLADAMTDLGYFVDGPLKLVYEPPEEVKKIYIEDMTSAAKYV